jgi:hypothetical protein
MDNNECADSKDAHPILRSLLQRPGFDREFAHALFDQARCRELDYASRCIAVLALENQLLAVGAAAADEFMPFLARLGFTPRAGAPCHIDVLKQGYTTIDPREFIRQLTRRLARLAPVHEMLRYPDAAPDAVAHFVRVAHQQCQVTLARAAFTPEEVVSRVLQHVRLTAAHLETPQGEVHFRGEAKAAAEMLPEYEADILTRLLGMVRSWWVGPATPTMTNALVECPAGTLALVIRPPGSSIEFEIKRVGLRGQHPLSVAFERRGYMLPPSHRLQGGAMLSVLHWEATNSALLSRLFRMIHGEPAPISRIVQLRSVKAVPRSDGGEISLGTWFESSASFGDGFPQMRRAMARSLSAFAKEGDLIDSVPRSPQARTRAFLSCTRPGQCTIVGTSALRLDNVSAWLHSGGPERYFKQAYGRAPDPGEAFRFADTILMEILGNYRPPAATASYGDYVARAFAEGENRSAADIAFRAAAASMGRLWGTLLGFRGYTEGESFVPRNVGLKAVWSDGAWRPQIVFMDHELTNIVGNRLRHFHPRTALPGMHKDWVHILGGELGGQVRPGTIAVLADIYRVNGSIHAEGRAIVIGEMQRAYHLTLQRLRDDQSVRSHFRRSFVEPLLAWDVVVGLYRASRIGPRQRSQWKGRMRRIMSAHGLEEPLIHEYRRAIRRHGLFLRRCPYLFDAGGVA